MWQYTLRLQRQGGRQVRLSLHEGDAEVCSADVPFQFEELGFDDAERLRWYWEEYLDRPGGASRRTAGDVEQRLDAIGAALFRALFGNPEGSRVWERAAAHLADLRLEICYPSADHLEPPWELITEPDSGRLLAARCRSFVRTPEPEALRVSNDPALGPLRILAVLCPPARRGEATFRSAFRLMADEAANDGRAIQWDILRPPTLARVSAMLLEAEAIDQPYHVLHFEGSGVFLDVAANGGLPAPLKGASCPSPDERSGGPRGYLLLDHAQDSSRLRLVDALDLAELLREARTPLLTLVNACEAVHRDSDSTLPLDAPRAFHAIAQELVELGSASVIHLAYRLDPETAAHQLQAVYDQVGCGASPGQAAQHSRRDAAERPERSTSFDRVRRKDAAVLQVHEIRDAAVLEVPRTAFLSDRDAAAEEPAQGAEPFAAHAAGRSRARSFGLDGLLVDLDRLFANHAGIVLHGEAGIGKSLAAAEYASWLQATDGLSGPSLHARFDERRGLNGLLDQLAAAFAEPLSNNGYRWEAMGEEERIETAVFVLNQIPLLWIWDGFESVHGRPGQESKPWSEEEAAKLKAFVEQAMDTQVRLLIVSRDDEAWLGGELQRRRPTPLPMRERLQLTRSILQSRHMPTREFERWVPVAEASRGNPLLLRLLVRQALHEGRGGEGDLHGMLDRALGPRNGTEAAGRAADDPLTAAIEYVMERGFSDPERDVLALVHLFGGYLDLDLLSKMYAPEDPHALRSLTTSAQTRAMLEAQPGAGFERAVDFGLLTPAGERSYRIEPPLAAAAERVFSERYPGPLGGEQPPTGFSPGRFAGSVAALAARTRGGDAATAPTVGRMVATDTADLPVSSPAGDPLEVLPRTAQIAAHAFVSACNRYGSEGYERDSSGRETLALTLEQNERNLMRSIELARANQWWDEVAGAAEGLGALYEKGGHVLGWQELTDGLTPDCMDPSDRRALPGREALWRALIEQQVRLAILRGVNSWAIELQKLAVEYDRAIIGDRFSESLDSWSSAERKAALRLAESLNRLGSIGRNDTHPLPEIEEEALELCEKLGALDRAADWAYQLGDNYTELPSIRNLSKAERWLRRGLELLEERSDRRSKFLAALGQVAWERFRHARSAERPESELIRHLTDARKYFERAIEHDRPNDYAGRASHHLHFGHVSYSLGDIDRALPHYRESIRYDRMRGNVFTAAKTRFNLAIALRDIGRYGEARKYAVASFDDLKDLQGGVPEMMLDRSRRLVENIEQRIEAKRKKRQGTKNRGAARW